MSQYLSSAVIARYPVSFHPPAKDLTHTPVEPDPNLMFTQSLVVFEIRQITDPRMKTMHPGMAIARTVVPGS